MSLVSFIATMRLYIYLNVLEAIQLYLEMIDVTYLMCMLFTHC